jgi:hypothetical protein
MERARPRRDSRSLHRRRGDGVAARFRAGRRRDDDRLVGKDALRAYFAAGLERYPALNFEPIELFVGVDSLVLHYRGARGDLAAEVVFLDSDGKVTRYFAHYNQP